MSASPTSRTLALLRKSGWEAYIVEKWCAPARRRIDAFGFGDVLAMKPGFSAKVVGADQFDLPKSEEYRVPGEILLVQACAGASHAARRDKILAEPRAKTWLQSGGGIWIVSWSKKGAAGKRKLWEERVERIELSAFPVLEPGPPPLF